MSRIRLSVVLGLALALMIALISPATAGSKWQEVEIQPGDSTTCEFEPGVFTEYEVDTSTLPQYDRYKQSHTVAPEDGMVHIQLKRDGVTFQKLSGPGPEVLVESQTTNLLLTFADGEQTDLKMTSVWGERTPDGERVDHNMQKFSGVDPNGDPILVSETGVCRG